MVELRRPVISNGLVKPQDLLEEPVPTAPPKKESVEPAAPKTAKKTPLIAPRHKPKPAPKPPQSTEEWINRANADGPATSILIKPIAVSLDAGSVQLLEDLAIQLSMNKLAVIAKMIQEAPDHLDEIHDYKKNFSDPPGPYLNRSFRIPEAVIVAANQLPKQLRIYGRSKIVRLLIAFFAEMIGIKI